jgi:hypothetical protein
MGAMAAPPRDPLALVWEREEEDQGKASTARSNATVKLCYLHKFCRQLQMRNDPLGSLGQIFSSLKRADHSPIASWSNRRQGIQTFAFGNRGILPGYT